MNSDQLEGKWKQVKGEVREKCEEQGRDEGIAKRPHTHQLNRAGAGCQGEGQRSEPPLLRIRAEP